MPQLANIVESLLIASDEALSARELAKLIRGCVAELTELEQATPELQSLATTSSNQVTSAIKQLNDAYKVSERSFRLIETTQGWKIYTQPRYAEFVAALEPGQKPQKLTHPAMETLAIIAYRQPITKAAIEAVRGVSCDAMLQKLIDRELIKISGRADLPGRPILYTTTSFFFDYFGIKNISELPNAKELSKVELPASEEPESEVQEKLQIDG